MFVVTFEDIYGQGKYISDVLLQSLEDQRKADIESDEELPPSKRELARRRKLEKSLLEVINYFVPPEWTCANYKEFYNEEE